MRTVGAFEAKTHLSQLLDEVEQGAAITTTRHGVPIARLAPMPDSARKSREDAVESLLRWREEHRHITTGDMSIREMIEEGRR